MNKTFLVVLGGLVLLIGVSILFKPKANLSTENTVSFTEKSVHTHAGFQLYKDNKLVDFSGLEYMHLEPCSEDDHEESSDDPEHEQEEKAHLHDNIGNIVHVHREGSVWGDLFVNIGVTLEPNIIAYVNGERVEDFLDYPIKEYDSVVIFEGENNDIANKLAQAVKEEDIVEAENRSESCGS